MSQDLLKNPLPEPWSFGVTMDGRIFFVNDEKQKTTWLHPDTGQAVMTGFHSSSDLPSGWEQGFHKDGGVYYIDHNKQTTTLHHPRRRYSIPSGHTNSPPLSVKKKRSSSFKETLTKPLIRLSSFQEKRFTSTRRRYAGGVKSKAQRDLKSVTGLNGWLFKRDSSGVGGVKLWRKRWFVLSDMCLFYYKDNEEAEVLGSIILPSYEVSTINPDGKMKRKYAFKLEHTGMAPLYLSAESYNEMAKWVARLDRLCKLATDSSPTKKRTDSKANEKKEENSKKLEEASPKVSDAEQHFDELEIDRRNTSAGDRLSTSRSNEKQTPMNANTNNSNAKSHSSHRQRESKSRWTESSSNRSRLSTSSASSRPSYSISSHSNVDGKELAKLSQPRQNSRRDLPENSADWSNSSSLRDADWSSRRVERNDSLVKLEKWIETQQTLKNSTKKSRDDDTPRIVSNSSRKEKASSAYKVETTRLPLESSSSSLVQPSSSYAIKQVDIQGKQGQLRAFAISRRVQPTEPEVAKQSIQVKEEAESEKSDQVERSYDHFTPFTDECASEIVQSHRVEPQLVPARNRVQSARDSRTSSVDKLTASTIPRNYRYFPSSARSNLSRTKSASERLLVGSHGNGRPTRDLDEVKRIQRQINRNRLRTLAGDYCPNDVTPSSYLDAHSPHSQIGSDVQTALKNNRMPKVLRRAKHEMQHSHEWERSYDDVDTFDVDCDDVERVRESDVEADDEQVDIDLSSQLVVPNKIDIPDRLMEYEDVELSPEQEKQKQKKIRAIESLLSRSGQPALQQPVHLAAALAAEAGTLARAVAYQANQNKDYNPSYV